MRRRKRREKKKSTGIFGKGAKRKSRKESKTAIGERQRYNKVGK